MKFYKRKIFYVPLLLFLLSIIVTSVLLYKPMKLIYWAAIDFPAEEERLAKLFHIKGNKESLNEFLKNYQPHTQEFETLLDFSKTAKRDFMIARYFGLEGDYSIAYMATMFINGYFEGFAGYISLGLKYNSPHINEKHIQFLSFVQSKTPSYLQNIQELIEYLTENKYFGDDSYKMMNAMRVTLVVQFFKSFENNEFCLLKEKDILFQQIQEDYQVLQSITDEKAIQEISLRFGSYDKMLKEYKGYVTQTKELLDECR